MTFCLDKNTRINLDAIERITLQNNDTIVLTMISGKIETIVCTKDREKYLFNVFDITRTFIDGEYRLTFNCVHVAPY